MGPIYLEPENEWIAVMKLFVLGHLFLSQFPTFLPYLQGRMSFLIVILYMLLTVTAQVSSHLPPNTKKLHLRILGAIGWSWHGFGHSRYDNNRIIKTNR